MKCPIDETVLQMTAREGIEIDYCPECRGVWLDRGELDKLIERAKNVDSNPSREENTGRGQRRRGEENERGGFLENIFDFM